MDYLLRGIFIGLMFGIPVGAVGVLTVQRTLRYGVKAGLFTGLGSSAADCFYACVGAFGFTLVSDFLLARQNIINIAGGMLILFMGSRLLLCKAEGGKEKTEMTGTAKMFLSSFAVGITNPAAILTFLFAFSYFGISAGAGMVRGSFLVCGVLIGTYIWWGTITAAAWFAQKKSGSFDFQKMNRIFGAILCLFGMAVFLRQILSGTN